MLDKFNIKLETLEDVRLELFRPGLVLTDKLKKKRTSFLLKVPLLSLIYKKKGPSNFNILVENIKMVKADFGDTVISSQEDRTFNIILRGAAMVFTRGRRGDQPKYNKKLMIGDYFGDTIEVGKERIESIRCVSLCYLLQMELKYFYHTFSGHFKCEEFIDRVNCLKEIWVFSKIKNTLLEKILLTSEHSKYVRGFVLFREKEPVNHLLVILEGEVTLKATSREGKQVPLSILTRSQVYGVE